MTEFGQEADEDGGGDRSDARHGPQDGLSGGQGSGSIEEAAHCCLDLGDGVAQPLDVTVEIVGDGCVGGLRPPPLLLHARGNELVAAPGQSSEALEVFPRWLCGLQVQCLPHGGEHGGIDPVGLGQSSGGTGEVARPPRIDACLADAGVAESLAQGSIITAGGLEHDDQVSSCKRGGEGRERIRPVGNPLMQGECRVRHVEPCLGDVDSNPGQ
jgi:hypothetical protein